MERSTSRSETVGEGSRRRRSEMRKKMWEEMEGRDSGGGGGVRKDDIGDDIGHLTTDLKDYDVHGMFFRLEGTLDCVNSHLRLQAAQSRNHATLMDVFLQNSVCRKFQKYYG